MHLRLLPFTVALLILFSAGTHAAPSSLTQRITTAISSINLNAGLALYLTTTPDPTIPKHLASNNRWLTLALTTNPDTTRKLTQAIANATLSPSIHTATWLNPRQIPLSDNMANLIIADLDALDQTAPPLAEIKRALIPTRGIALIKQNQKWSTITKPMPKSFDTWTHFHHSATGNAVSNDTAVKVPNALRFIGGPRLQDSNGANAWRIAHGVAIHEWNYPVKAKYTHRYFIEARDAFNGTLLWQKLITSKKRMGGRSYKHKPFIIADHKLIHIDFSTDQWKLAALDIYTGKTITHYKESFDIRSGLDKHADLNLPQMKIANGTIYQAHGPNLRALNLQSGKKLWQYNHNQPDTALAKFAVATDLNLLFAIEAVKYKKGHGKPAYNWNSGRYPSARGQALIAINTQTGKRQWRTPIDPRLIDYSKVEPWTVDRRGNKVRRDNISLLNYKDGRLFTLYACDANHGNPSLVWALDAKTGKTLWLNAAGPRSDSKGHQVREMFDLFALNDGTLLSLGHSWCRLDQQTGKILAFGSLAGNARCDTHSCTTNLVTAGFGNYFKLNQDPNKIQWTRRDLARGQCGGRSTPAYGMTYHKGSGCGCFDPIRGNMALHHAPTPLPLPDTSRLTKGPTYNTPPKSIKPTTDHWPDYLGAPNRSLWSNATGPTKPVKQRWSQKLSNPLPQYPKHLDKDRLHNSIYNGPLTAPIIAQNLVIVANRDVHQILARHTNTGQPAWSYQANGRIITPPTYRSGYIVFGTRDGYVHTLHAQTGQLAWKFLAAPQQRFLVAYGQIESAWPLHGSLPIVNNTIIASAGYHGEADGGVWTYGLSLTSGKILWKKQLHRPQRPWQNGTPKKSREGFGTIINFKDTPHELASTGKRANGGYAITLVRNIDLPASNGNIARIARTPLNAQTGQLTTAGKTSTDFRAPIPFPRYHERFPFLDMEFEDRGGPHGKGGWIVHINNKQIGDFRAGHARMAFNNNTVYIAKPHYHKSKRVHGMIILRVTQNDLPEGRQKLRWQDMPVHSFHQGLHRIDSFIVSGDFAYYAAEAIASPHPWLKDKKLERQLKNEPIPGYIGIINLKTGREIQRLKLHSTIINNGLAITNQTLYATTESGHLLALTPQN